ncbi:DUF502 domain-containing protein, partial [candidate division KSB1 bacterium]
IYTTLRKVTESMSRLGKERFKKAIIIEYPRKGLYTIGFITNENAVLEYNGEIQSFTSVFIPSTPNPTTGYLIFVPKEDIIDIDLTIEEGIKTVISGGILTPDNLTSIKVKEKGEKNG